MLDYFGVLGDFGLSLLYNIYLVLLHAVQAAGAYQFEKHWQLGRQNRSIRDVAYWQHEELPKAGYKCDAQSHWKRAYDASLD
jgi:hypothetical protein